MLTTIDGVQTLISDDSISLEEATYYVRYVLKHQKGEVLKIWISLTDDGEVQLDYDAIEQKFERIRRITGYLVGTVDRWNNAKRAELRERVKHDGGDSNE